MKTKNALMLLLVLLASAACGNKNKTGGGKDVSGPSSSAVMMDESSVLRQMNQVRQRAGLSSLRVDQTAEDAARAMAADRSDRRILRGESVCDELRRRRRGVGSCAEIYGRWFTNISDTTDYLGLWLRTPRVRALIRDRYYRRVGIGVSSDRQGRTHGVVVFLP